MNKIIKILGLVLLISLNIVCGQTYSGTNATGWSELYDDGDLLGAAFEMYDTNFSGWVVAILFIVYQFMLLLKTRNLTLAWITGIIFVSLYLTSEIVKSISSQVIFVLLVMELAGILYFLFWK